MNMRINRTYRDALYDGLRACPEMLARLAEDDLLDLEVRQGAAAGASTE